MFNFIRKNKFQFGTGCIPDEIDKRDLKYDDIVGGEFKLSDDDWKRGFDIEKELNIKIPLKNQGNTLSCCGQGLSYYTAILNAVETKKYIEVSAKSIYSQIFLPKGGASIRDGAKLIVDWGALSESYLPSYENNNAPSENFIRDLSWKNKKADDVAKVLQAKEYRVIAGVSMDIVANAIKNNYGVVSGLYGQNNGTWSSNEPQPPKSKDWAHCLFYGKFGIDKLGKYISTPNSWGTRNNKDDLHQDDWQKLREDYFTSELMFNSWTLVDKPNIPFSSLSEDAKKVINSNEGKIIIEAEGTGRKGIIINSVLREIKNGREASACLYSLSKNGLGSFVKTDIFNEITKGDNF